MNLTRFKLAQLGLAAAAVFAASTASAAPVANWDYYVSSAFTGPTTFNAATQGGSSSSVGSTEISWGRAGGTVGDDRSALQINNTPTPEGVLETNTGIFDPANTYTHVNNGNIGLGSTSLHSTVITATLFLKPDGALDFFPSVATYNVNFYETPNSGTCAEASTTKCADVFVLDGPLTAQFDYLGYLYTVTFQSDKPLIGLSDDSCLKAGADIGCSGFVTQEGEITNVNFSLKIDAQAIPEPASIALLGAGLLGLAGIRRRQQKNKA